MPKNEKPELTDEQLIERKNDWPCWPFLPLKRRQPDRSAPECATLIDTIGTGYVVKLAGMYDPNLGKADSIKYTTVAMLLADGWRID